MRKGNIDYLRERINRKNLDVIRMVNYDDIDECYSWSKESCEDLLDVLKHFINEYECQYKTQAFIESEVIKLEKYISSHF